MSSEPSVAPELPRVGAWLRPIINRVAALRASVHTKLLGGFMLGAALLLAMAALSLGVLGHMADRVSEIDVAQERLDLLRQTLYLVTSQSHYRTMSLLTHDDSNVASIANAKADLLVDLDRLDQLTPPSQRGLMARVRDANARFNNSGVQVLALYQAGRSDDALALHLSQEHPLSHEIEQPVGLLLNDAEQQMEASRATFDADQHLLTNLVIAFSAASLVIALLLGFVLSWSFLLPLQTVQRAMARIAGGQFDQHVELPNRDEFGALATNLNSTSQELAAMYGTLEDLNRQLRGTNTELLAQLQAQVEELARSRGLITQAEERLRRELAEVLHSRVQNRLLMVWYRLEDALDLVRSDPAAAAELLFDIRQQVDDIREQDVRELSHRLHPSIIRAGLLPALETLAEELPRLEIIIAADAEVRSLDDAARNAIPEAVRLTAYRVVEEALGNAVKHANATHVDVELHLTSSGLAVTVRDNGEGFNPRTLRPGLGLGSISARVGRVGGTWTISAAPGEGTLLTVVLPLSVEQVQDGLHRQVTLGQEHGADADSSRAVAHFA
ncbi:MAG: HAMP domain-containing protein [Chloroflexi bacterium]|nr:HAMP domain-containing protein [Chloroflexota bacterium]